ncbi:hypothetical protein WMY93_030771 [Mugilogobius chulae]|uniref:Spindle and centriole-associated protein 1 n=1 Tax=Mugilogobius chulae TaxID=88201 RepID=A0AAW0MRA7_9GOBI
MSSMRFGRQQLHSKGKRTLRPKKTAPPKKEWVGTVNDLSVHKLTPAELNHRHEMMKSHNKVSAQWDLREKALKKRLKHGSPSPLDETSLSIIREVLSDQILLQDVLARSDRAMSVVKDIFGDAPRRQTGHPSVTRAPNCNSDSVLPVFERPDPPTELSLLSQSTMNPQALNEIGTNVRKMRSRTTGKVVRKQITSSIPVTPIAANRAPDHTALNATAAVQRVRRSHSHYVENNDGEIISQVLNPENPLGQMDKVHSSVRKTKKCADHSTELDGSSVASVSGDQSSLGLLQSMLGQVEADLDCCSPDTIPTTDHCPHPQRTKGLTGFSVALVSTLGRLVQVLKQNKEECQKATWEKRQIEEELTKQRDLINALNAENTALREKTAALQHTLSEIEEKIDTVVLVMGGTELPGNPTQEHVSDAGLPGAPTFAEERDHVQTHATPAVLLSPLQQSAHWSHVAEAKPIPAQLLHSSESIPALASNLTSLPSTSSVSLSSLSSKVSAEAMMAEIAQLSRQNELIKSQLLQARTLAPGSRASPDNSYLEERRLSCGSKNSPHTEVGRRVSRSSSAKSPQQAESEQQQAETSVLNMSSVELRLLELNKQSAAARTRLLEIIDQQKHITSAKLSPSVSPVSHSAVGPVTGRVRT